MKIRHAYSPCSSSSRALATEGITVCSELDILRWLRPSVCVRIHPLTEENR